MAAHALGHFCFFFQFQSEAIHNSQFQARLNEVIRTLTEVRSGISSPWMGHTSPLLSFSTVCYRVSFLADMKV